jgi:hypothetical protein
MPDWKRKLREDKMGLLGMNTPNTEWEGNCKLCFACKPEKIEQKFPKSRYSDLHRYREFICKFNIYQKWCHSG